METAVFLIVPPCSLETASVEHKLSKKRVIAMTMETAVFLVVPPCSLETASVEHKLSKKRVRGRQEVSLW
jgi:hypothetical protein